MIPMRFAAIVVAAVAAGACAAPNPTGPTSAEQLPARPRLDGGVMYGSGNRTDITPSPASAAPTQTVIATDSVEAAADAGGVMYGSGN